MNQKKFDQMKFYSSILSNNHQTDQSSYMNMKKQNDFSINIDIQRVSLQSQCKSPLIKFQNENIKSEKVLLQNKESAEKNLYEHQVKLFNKLYRQRLISQTQQHYRSNRCKGKPCEATHKQ